MQMQMQKHESASATPSELELSQEYTCATMNLYRKGASAAESNEATRKEA